MTNNYTSPGCERPGSLVHDSERRVSTQHESGHPKNANRVSVVCGMSGGVDSSLTAMLLRDGGYAVTGGTLIMHGSGETDAARAAAESLGIPFAALDCRAEFEERVSSYMVRGYSAGRTPSPCVVCNRMLKLEMLCRLADSLGIGKIATGHYAGVGFEDGRYFVRRSPDPKKDQSYFLCMTTQAQLSRLVLPLADYTKAEVRALALDAGLKAAEKRDSQELCFIPDGDYARYIEERCGAFPDGEFIAPDGKAAGRHKGIIHYTVGQRKGLGIALGRPVFVSRIDAAENRVYLSDAGGEFSDTARLKNLNFQLLAPPTENTTVRAFVKHRAAALPAACSVDIIYNKKEENSGFSDVCYGCVAGEYGTDGGYSAVVRFDSPARAVAPGQFCAAYDADGRVLFGGEIC